MFTIYCLLDPDTLLVRYVGLTNNPKRRAADHTSNKTYLKLAESSYYKRWRSSLAQYDKVPIFAVLNVYLTEVEAIEAEGIWILCARAAGFKLVNYYNGSGKGYRQGVKRPEEWCENLRRGHLGKKYGPQNPERVAKVVAARMRRWRENPWATNAGKYTRTEKHRQPRSIEVRTKISIAQTGKVVRPWTDDERAAASIARRGELHRKWTQVEKDAIAAAHMKRRHLNCTEESLLILSPLENSVVRLRFGIFGEPLLIRRQIAEVLGISLNQARWAERVALDKLKKVT